MKARNLKCHVMSETTASALETTVNTWFAARTEEIVVELRYAAASSLYTAIVFYTE